MKKRMGKRGFTIVELVIVIAVIAILAAVLIPTFSNLINKANLSSDQVAVRNMNNALAMDEAQNGKPSNLIAAMLRMKENGYDFDRYKPLTDGYRFFWHQEENKVVLVELESMSVVYPEEMKTVINEDNAAAYKPLYRDTEADRVTVQNLKEKISKAEDKTVAITDESELRALAAIVNGSYEQANPLENYIVTLPESIEIENVWVPIGEAEKTPFKGTLKGAENGTVITGLTSDGYTADVANAVKLASGQIGVSYGLVAFAEDAAFENIKLENVSIDLGDSGVEMGALIGTATGSLTVKNCQIGTATDGSYIRGKSKIGSIVGVLDRVQENYSVVFENCVNYAAVEAVDSGDSVRAGGLVGALNFPYDGSITASCTFTKCENYGSVTSTKYAGGFIGHRYGGPKTLVFSDCKSSGIVTGASGCYGYYIGWIPLDSGANTSHIMQNCTYGEDKTLAGVSDLKLIFGSVENPATATIGDVTYEYDRTSAEWIAS